MQLEREDAERIALAGGEPARELVLGLLDQLAKLQERVGRLEEQGRKSSRNSSQAPLAGSAEDARRAASGGAQEGEGVV